MQHIPTFFLQTSSLQLFVDKVSSGFGVTPLQAVAAGMVLLCFLAVLIWYNRREKRLEEQRHYRRAEELFRTRCQSRGLTASDEELVAAMSRYLSPPLHKADILTSPRLFERCARRLREGEHISEERLATLRQKLGLRPAAPEEIPGATWELPESLPLQLFYRGSSFRGEIAEPPANRLKIRISPGNTSGNGSSLPPLGGEVKVFFHLPSGIYSFSTRILDSSRIFDTGNTILELRHSDAVRREQRRQYFRKKLRLPVFIIASSTEGRALSSKMYDLSGGGASVLNPQNRIGVEEEVTLSFSPSGSPSGENFQIPARVVRTSRKGRILHLAFTSIPEAVRDRIIGSLHQRSSSNPPSADSIPPKS